MISEKSSSINVYQRDAERDFHLEKGVDGITVVGDRIGRLPFIDLVDAKKGETVLEAGCGGGWVARKLAKSGANVTGCDKTVEMLADAIKVEKELQQSIQFVQADITELPFDESSFDKVVNIATLFHLDPEECKKFFIEARRVLKSGGELFLSLNHFDLFSEGNPVREGKTNWMTLDKKDSTPDMDTNQIFTEHYWNKDGKVFVVDIWYHPKAFLLKSLQEAGFEIVQERSTYITQEVMEEFKRDGESGYPAFWQIQLKKSETL